MLFILAFWPRFQVIKILDATRFMSLAVRFSIAGVAVFLGSNVRIALPDGIKKANHLLLKKVSSCAWQS